MSSLPLVFDVSVSKDSASTSAFGQLLGSRPLSVILVGGALTIPGTSSAQPDAAWEERYEHASGPTTSGLSFETPAAPSENPAELTNHAIAELRRISGLTWDQLSQLFQVSRRSVHFWASGKAMNAANLERLMQVLEVIRAGDRGDARRNRTALLERTNGASPFDLLVAQDYDQARTLLGRGSGRRQVASVPLSAAARAARMPPPPAELVDAKHDRIPGEVDRGRAVRTVRNKRSGPGR